MARILIITAWYRPFIHPRAHRWTSLAEYWAAQGHELHVLCARRGDCPDETAVHGVQVHRAGFDSLKEWVYYLAGVKAGRGRVGAGVRKPGSGQRLLAWLYRAVWKNLYFPDDACLWYFPARRKAQALLALYRFDALITVSLPFTGHLIGLDVRRRHPGLPWLADIGDPFSFPGQALNNARLYGRLNRRLEAAVLERADAAVVTNAAAARRYARHFGAVAVRVIPPLFHPAALPPAVAAAPRAGRPVRLGYFGALYRPVRTPDALLQLLDRTLAEQPGLQGRLELHCYGDIFPEFYDRLRRHACVQLHGLRPRAEVRAAMQDMDLLVSIGNRTDYQLPSKAVDYLASGKPVLHLSYVAGDPFVDFWGDAPGLLSLPVREGRISDAGFHRWLRFLEREHTPADRTQLLESCTISAVAGAYISLLLPAAALRSLPDIPAAPGHR